MARALALASISAAGDRPADLLDVAIALLATARGRPAAQIAKLIDASAILLEAARGNGAAADEEIIAGQVFVKRRRRRKRKARADGPDEAKQRPAPKHRERDAERAAGQVTIARQRQPQVDPSPAAASELKLAANGVTIAGRDISFKGKSITLAPKEALVAAELVRVMPNLLGHDVLARKLWPEASSQIGQVCAAQATLSLSKSVEAIGLKVTRMRGIGAGISEAA